MKQNAKQIVKDFGIMMKETESFIEDFEEGMEEGYKRFDDDDVDDDNDLDW